MEDLKFIWRDLRKTYREAWKLSRKHAEMLLLMYTLHLGIAGMTATFIYVSFFKE